MVKLFMVSTEEVLAGLALFGGGAAVGAGGKYLVDELSKPNPPADHVQLVSKFVVTATDTGRGGTTPYPTTPVCRQVIATPIAGQAIPDMDSQWDFCFSSGPYGPYPVLRLGVHTWNGGNVYTISVIRLTDWQITVKIVGAQPQQGAGPWGYAAYTTWGTMAEGYVVLSWPIGSIT
jgi:hypothetical protein